MPQTLEQMQVRQAELQIKAQNLSTKRQNGTWNEDTDGVELKAIFAEHETLTAGITAHSNTNAMLQKMIAGTETIELGVSARTQNAERRTPRHQEPRTWSNRHGIRRQFTLSDEERRILSVNDPAKPIDRITNDEDYLRAFNAYLRKPTLYRDGIGSERFMKEFEGNPKILNILRQDDDTRGGMFTLPEYLMDGILKELDDATHCLSLANQITVESSDTMSIRTRTDKATFVGTRSELGNYLKTIENGLAFGKRSMRTNEFAMVALLSTQLLDHATTDVWSMYMEEIKLSGSEWTEQKLLYGTGVNEPLGLFQTVEGGGIQADRDITVISGDHPSTAPSDWHIYDHFGYRTLLRMYLALKPGYQVNSRWMFNSNQIMNLCLLTDSVGQYIWKPDTLTGIGNTLLGRPVIHNRWCPNLEEPGEYFGILGDFSKYWVLWHRRMRMQTLREIMALQGMVVTTLDFQFDGQPIMSEAFVRGKYDPD
jgi:HK97 family phage major capsid protein